jgi:hypothetical protein
MAMAKSTIVHAASPITAQSGAEPPARYMAMARLMTATKPREVPMLTAHLGRVER